ncbi:MAG: hypothetical protein JRG96_09655 [Deltaproteobacteria bacterium]|nr:hypothetical protein [Deltaproteobacteria bacterium]MBW2418349.1 hypothetical protein [Deltaproteobacteria bacterium]
MASIREQDGRYEIRECLSTERGPRQRILASFRGVLTPEVLDRAEEKALKPLKRMALVARALAMEIPVTHRRRYPEARALLAKLQRGGRLDPGLAALLRAALEPLPSESPPAHLEDAAEWIGQPEGVRGSALRGLLRTADRIVRSRGPLRTRPRELFPRFSSDPSQAS